MDQEMSHRCVTSTTYHQPTAERETSGIDVAGDAGLVTLGSSMKQHVSRCCWLWRKPRESCVFILGGPKSLQCTKSPWAWICCDAQQHQSTSRRWEASHLQSWAFVWGGCFVSFCAVREKHLQGLYLLGWEWSSLCCSCCLLHPP